MDVILPEDTRPGVVTSRSPAAACGPSLPSLSLAHATVQHGRSQWWSWKVISQIQKKKKKKRSHYSGNLCGSEINSAERYCNATFKLRSKEMSEKRRLLSLDSLKDSFLSAKVGIMNKSSVRTGKMGNIITRVNTSAHSHCVINSLSGQPGEIYWRSFGRLDLLRTRIQALELIPYWIYKRCRRAWFVYSL